MTRRSARDLHPGAWWLWALGLAVAASATTNPLLLLIIVAIAGAVVAARRSDQAWSLSFRLYLALGALIVAIRVVFRVLLGSGYDGHVLLDLPVIPLPDWAAGIRLLGPITRESLMYGLDDGLRLATLVICVGAANSLANPKRLLKSMPPALYEVGTAVVVATAMLPQLADSVRRVRAARRLRGVPGGRVARLRGVVVPVLEDALERSLALAAGMDARGYGRAGNLTRGRRWFTGLLLMGGLVGICVGVYAVLDHTAPRWLALPMLAAGCALAVGGFWSAGRRVQRTRYRPDTWRLPELLVAATGILVAVGFYTLVAQQGSVLLPDVSRVPPVTPEALAVVLLGVLPAFVAPPAVLSTDGTPEPVGAR